MVQINLKIKPGYEHLYKFADKKFIEMLNFKKIDQGIYISDSKKTDNQLFHESAECIDELCEMTDFMKYVESFTETIGNETDDIVEYYNEYYGKL